MNSHTPIIIDIIGQGSGWGVGGIASIDLGHICAKTWIGGILQPIVLGTTNSSPFESWCKCGFGIILRRYQCQLNRIVIADKRPLVTGSALKTADINRNNPPKIGTIGQFFIGLMGGCQSCSAVNSGSPPAWTGVNLQFIFCSSHHRSPREHWAVIEINRCAICWLIQIGSVSLCSPDLVKTPDAAIFANWGRGFHSHAPIPGSIRELGRTGWKGWSIAYVRCRYIHHSCRETDITTNLQAVTGCPFHCSPGKFRDG